MAMEWSPGCGCCDPCKSIETDYTPTSPKDRGLAAWVADTAYLANDTFYETSTVDSYEYQYEVPSNLTSGSTWDATEEARYTKQQRADYFDEVTEWHLYGSGWATLSAADLHAYLAGGKLGYQMGLISKSDVLPDRENWNLIFDFEINNSISPYTQPESPLRIQFFSNLTINGSNEPTDYFFCEQEWIEGNYYGITESNLDLSDRDLKVTIGEVVATVATNWDVAYKLAGQSHRNFCRRPDVSGGQFRGGADLSEIPKLYLDNLTAGQYSDQGAAFTIVDDGGVGVIYEDSGETDSITVADGDVITLDDWTDPADKTNWTKYSPGTSVSLTDVITSGLSKENPDTDDSQTGMKIGIYIADTQASGVFDIINFSRATTKLNGTITTPECQVCTLAFHCPCPLSQEQSVFADLATTSANYSDAAGMFDLAGSGTWSNWGYWSPFDFPGAGRLWNLGGGATAWGYSDWTVSYLGLLGTTVQRTSNCGFTIARLGVKTAYLPYDAGNWGNGFEFRLYLFEVVTLAVEALQNFTVRMETNSTFYVGKIDDARSIGSGDSASTLTDVQNEGWPDNFWNHQFTGFGIEVERLAVASGTANSTTDLESYDCTSFTIAGTYSTNDLAVWWSDPNPTSDPLQTQPYPEPTQLLTDGDGWTVQNA